MEYQGDVHVQVLTFSLEILRQPKKMVSEMSALGLKHVGSWGQLGAMEAMEAMEGSNQCHVYHP